MRPIACLAAVAALVTALPAAAQTPAPAQSGLSVAEVSAWLTAKGGQVGAVQHNGAETFVTVTDGPLTWAVFFYGCANDVCADIQFSAAFSNATITVDKVNDWNRDHRFLKAFYMPASSGGDPSAAVQYDVLLRSGGGVDQLTDPASVWVGMVGDFATQVGYFRAEGEAAPATPPATPPAN